jgi:hypothetical protein
LFFSLLYSICCDLWARDPTGVMMNGARRTGGPEQVDNQPNRMSLNG